MSAVSLEIRPADLPTPPKVALEIMRACARDDCSNADLGTLAARDAALAAEALRIVNSAWFGFREEVLTVAHAAVILGQRALRNLVLCIAVRDALADTVIAGFDNAQFAEDSLRRAVAAGLLAPFTGVDREEAFTAGLLQDFGLLALFVARTDAGVTLADLRCLDPDRRVALERERFGATHDATGAALAGQWELPQDLCAAISAHHAPQTADLPALAKTLRGADWVAAVYETADHAACLTGCRALLGDLLGLLPEQVDACLEQLPQSLAAAARDLGVRAGAQPSFEALMREANATLAEENLSYQELTLRLRNTLRERDRLAAELDRELEQAREIQRALLPGPGPDQFPVVGVNVSAKQLSGDFYDYFPLADGGIFFCLGDVSGKGANAAILMAKVAGLCRCLARRGGPLAELVETVNREITETSAHGMFVTLACGVFDPGRARLAFVNAGHLPGLLLAPGQKPRLLKALGPPLGVLEESVYRETVCTMSGSSLYLFSDGVTECRDADGGELGIGGLLKLLAASDAQSPQQQLQFVVEQLIGAGREARDDLTLVRVTAAAT